MSQKLKLAFTLFFILAMCGIANAQGEKSVHAIIDYEPSEAETQAQARMTAIQRARQKALEDEFGLVVAQTNITNVSNGDLHFRSLGISDVAGEWLGDTKEPVTSLVTQGDRLIIKAEVWGKARKIVSEKIDLDVHILRNTPSKSHAARNFLDNDKFFISFKSPIDGFLSVYMMDDSMNFQRILPYMDSKLKSYQVEGNKEYISHCNDEIPGFTNFEYTSDMAHVVLAPGKSLEECMFYVLFSPNKFLDPDDDESKRSYKYREGLMLPPSVNQEHMQEWLLKNRRHDKMMQVVKIPIMIKPFESY